jgi:transposase
LELHFLPPYAPDLNPDEFVWQHAKTNGAAKKPLRRRPPETPARPTVYRLMSAIRLFLF